MLKQLQSNLNRKKDWYNTYRQKIILTSRVKIKNKRLYQELEQECKKQNGILTYAEYITIDQFGKNGFYATSTLHGKTDVEKRWGNALAYYCQKFGHDSLIEVGCGTGELGIAIAKKYQQLTKKHLKWIGVEIDQKIHKNIYDNFRSQKMQDSIDKIVATLDELQTQDSALIIFPYSLDNIPPHIFLNTSSGISYPNALLGIKTENGMVSEIIIPPEILYKKGISLTNGFFMQNNFTYNLSSWKLRKGQRAYISTDAFISLYKYAKKFDKNPTLLIIDEFRREPWFFNLENLGAPKSLYENNLVCSDRRRYYHESGKYNIYYPLYRDSLFKFLNGIGFQSIDYDIEQKEAARLGGGKWFAIRENYATLAFFATNFVNKKIAILPIPFDPMRIF